MDNPYVPPEAALTDAHAQGGPGRPAHQPTAATVFGILNIMFGGIGLLCMPFAFLGLFAPQEAPGGNPVNAILLGQPVYRAWTYASVGLGIVGSGALLAAGIGLLMTRPWGRSVSVGYAWYIILMSVLALLMAALYTLGPLWNLYRHTPRPEVKMLALYSLIAGAAGPFLGMIYPVLMLFFLSRPDVVKAYRRRDEEMFSIS